MDRSKASNYDCRKYCPVSDPPFAEVPSIADAELNLKR
jgi:hypothetical protein